jgi:hypothetical protein
VTYLDHTPRHVSNTRSVVRDGSCYLRDPHAPIAHAHGLIVLTLTGEHIAAITRFLDNSVLPRFGLPRTLPE